MSKGTIYRLKVLICVAGFASIIGCGGGGETTGTELTGGSAGALSVSSASSISQFLDEISPYVDEKVINRWRTYNASVSDSRYDIYRSLKTNFLIAGRYNHFAEESYPSRNAEFTLLPINRYVLDYEGSDFSSGLREGSGARVFIGFKNQSRPLFEGARLKGSNYGPELKDKPLDALIILNSITYDDQGELYESIKVWEGVFAPPGYENANAWGDVFVGNYTQIMLSFSDSRKIPDMRLPKVVETYKARWERSAKIDVSVYDYNDDNAAPYGIEIAPSNITSGIYSGRVFFDLPENVRGFFTSYVRFFVNSDREIIGSFCLGSIRSDGFLNADCSQDEGLGKFLLTGTLSATNSRLAVSGTSSILLEGESQPAEVAFTMSLNKEPEEGPTPLRNFSGTWVVASFLSLGLWPQRHYLVEIDQNGNITNNAEDTRCQVNGKLSINKEDETSISLSLNTAYRQIFLYSQHVNNDPICDPSRANATEFYEFGADTTHSGVGLLPIDFDGIPSPDSLIFAKKQAPILYNGSLYYSDGKGTYYLIMYRPPVINE